MRKLFFFAMAAILLLPGTAGAEETKKLYLGAGGMYAIQDFDLQDVDLLEAIGFNDIAFDNTFGLNAFIGYRFTDQFALELDFTNLPGFKLEESATLINGHKAYFSETVDFMTFALEAKYLLSAGKGFFPYLEAGVGLLTSDAEGVAVDRTTGQISKGEADQSALLARLGFGCEKYFTDAFSVRLEADYTIGFNVLEEARYFTIALGASVHL